MVGPANGGYALRRLLDSGLTESVLDGDGKAAEFALSAEETDSLLVDSSDEQAVTLNSVAAAATEAMMLCARTRGRSPCLVDQQ